MAFGGVVKLNGPHVKFDANVSKPALSAVASAGHSARLCRGDACFTRRCLTGKMGVWVVSRASSYYSVTG